MDDDLKFNSNTTLDECRAILEANPDVDCVGFYGVLYDKDRGYMGSPHINGRMSNSGVFVDIVKGRFMFMRTKSLNGLDTSPDFTCDDIKVSSHLKSKAIIPLKNNGFTDLIQNDAVSLRPDHNEKRNSAGLKYFNK
jgi:hypothetical protein